MERWVSILGLFTMLAIAWGLSVDRRAIRWRPVIVGTALQFAFALAHPAHRGGRAAFEPPRTPSTAFLDFTDAGAAFIFGERFGEHYFAFKVLPTIIFFSSFITILYYLGVLQWVVGLFARVMMRLMGTSGPSRCRPRPTSSSARPRRRC
jgi:concentrative nucleoside transporter, CNT family